MAWALEGPVLYQDTAFVLWKEPQRVGTQGGWLTQGLDGENLGPHSLLKYHFHVGRLLRISPKPMQRDCSQHTKLRHHLLRHVQALSFISSVHASSTAITKP